MDQPDREAEPQFSQPVRQVILMLIALGLAVTAGFFVAPSVLPIFEANPYLNGLIGVVFLAGLMGCFWQVAQLVSSVRWIESFAAGTVDAEGRRAPQLLAPLATLLRSRSKRMQLSSQSTSSILESVATRIEEAREITRYLVSLLIFLGLLGTFYGLATTVPAVVDTIRSLSPQEGEEALDVFNRLMTGLESQLGGMGVAFGSSLLGLSGSLVVGLLELFAGHGQNRFYRELEEWLSSITRLGMSSAEGEGGADTQVLSGIIDTMSDQIETLQTIFTQSEMNRAVVDEKLSNVLDSMERLSHRMGDHGPLNETMMRVAQGQETLIQHMQRDLDKEETVDAESRMRLRSIDVQLLRLLEEVSAGRQETMAELRADLAALGRSLQGSQLSGGQAMVHRMRGMPPEKEG
ncbi:biopolymer transporter ExbB [Pseudooceanicola onchidii]|uniref:biopolymer transporter ExbB n=1 Tax=Pseudooceanicola onchidii TaxID=2562279 RepID=UPI001F0FDE54|nr:biopolymer transporter ExbB [Pseudooceanicola onchidii]